MSTLHDVSWERIQALRSEIDAAVAASHSLADAGQCFASAFAKSFSTVALARVFLVAPMDSLPPQLQTIARAFAVSAGKSVDATTPVLTLLGSAGARKEWNHRDLSAGHRAIPLVDQQLVDSAPMIAALLASFQIDVANLRAASPVQLRNLVGGLNTRFYVPDARDAKDGKGRQIIAARDFVAANEIRTVFGMGGRYINGMLAVAILFTREVLDASAVDRFASFISSFKLATAEIAVKGPLFT